MDKSNLDWTYNKQTNKLNKIKTKQTNIQTNKNTKQNKTKQNKTKQNKTKQKQNKTKQNKNVLIILLLCLFARWVVCFVCLCVCLFASFNGEII